MDYISTFIPKKAFRTRIETNGTPQVFALAYIPPYFKVNQYWLRTNVKSTHTDVTGNDDDASQVGPAEQYELQMYGFMLNQIPGFDTDSNFDFMKDVFTADGTVDIHHTGPESEGGLASNLGLTGQTSGKMSSFAEQRKFFERETILGLPKNAIIIDSQQIMLTDEFSTNGTKLGRGTNIDQGRFMVFVASAGVPYKETGSNLRLSTFGSTNNMETINADFQQAKYSARYGANMVGDGTSIAAAETGMIRTPGGNASSTPFVDSITTGSDTVLNNWMFTGFSEISDIQEQTDVELNINSYLTLRVDAYEPRQNHIITT